MRSASGIGGVWFGIYGTMYFAAVRPFVDFFLGSRPVPAGAPPLGAFLRSLLVSGRGVGIDKKGNGDAKDQRVEPLGRRATRGQPGFVRCTTDAPPRAPTTGTRGALHSL